MRLEYQCDLCQVVKDNHSMDSFACDCGGTYRKYDLQAVHVFEPYYDRTLRSVVTSERDKEKKARSLRNYSHPEGLYNVRDDKKFMKEMAYIQKHREEYKSTLHKGYKPRTQGEIEKRGEKAYDPSRPDIDRFKSRIYSYSR